MLPNRSSRFANRVYTQGQGVLFALVVPPLRLWKQGALMATRKVCPRCRREVWWRTEYIQRNV